MVVDEKEKNKKSNLGGRAAGTEAVHSLTHRLRLQVEEFQKDYYWEAKDAKAAQRIAKKINYRWQQKHNQPATDEEVLGSFAWLIQNLPNYYKDKWDMTTLSSKFDSIMLQITNTQQHGSEINGRPARSTGESRMYGSLELLNQTHQRQELAS